MKTLIGRFAVMSTVLILLCANVVAQNVQNEKSTKNYSNDSYGVIVSEDYVLLRPGEERNISVIVQAGYVNPRLIYQGETLQINETIDGDSFTAEIIELSRSFCSIRITAKQVTIIDSDVLYAIAEMSSDDGNFTKSLMRNLGAVIVITVDPSLAKE